MYVGGYVHFFYACYLFGASSAEVPGTGLRKAEFIFKGGNALSQFPRFSG